MYECKLLMTLGLFQEDNRHEYYQTDQSLPMIFVKPSNSPHSVVSLSHHCGRAAAVACPRMCSKLSRKGGSGHAMQSQHAQ